MAECYCAKIENGVVTQVIVCGCAEWAAASLGGEWVSANEQLVCIGWTRHADGFRPPRPYPSWTWDDGWQPPVPMPASGQWMWDESSLSWVAWESVPPPSI